MPSHLSLRTLPVLDLGSTHPDTLRAAARDTGAFLLAGHGIRPEVPGEVVDLARLFFALPTHDKAAVDAAGSEQFRGWTSFGTGRDLGWREQFDIGAELPAVKLQDRTHPGDALVGPNRWPARLPALRDRALWFQDRATEVARAVLRQLAVGLGQDCDVFDRALAGSPATWTTLARDGEATAAGSAVPAHTDAGILTLRWLDAQSTGLQVLADHRWVDATGHPDTFLVTIGEALTEATDGYLRAAPHRTLPAQAERVTLTYAFDAPLDATVPHLDLPADLGREWAQAA
ncbi:Isopenicillin N synthase [Raineyella antarctica]|uniref:Isopenicillin N synthase n=1 Tax=Raineyella antarctica TaxID=1577474 RepID=A0A1G6GGL8_9ACTN|nr:2-oxoglutarate and iron-dependent oxygenase domain-containing protein [Raineyella antarctica]SDB81137.1 Isopenicillin N synthase [Raineyella antarctica]